MVKENTAYVTYDRRIIFIAIQILSIYVLDTVKVVLEHLLVFKQKTSRIFEGPRRQRHFVLCP